MIEQWKDIPNYEGYYQASSLGRIRRVKSWKSGIGDYWFHPKATMKPGTTRGYSRVVLFRDGTSKRYMVHVLVMLTFVGLKPEGMQINHKNGNKTDCSLRNLEYVTVSENQLHSVRVLGRPNMHGSQHGRSKLVEAEVIEIRRLRESGMEQKEIARLFNVCVPTVSMICLRKIWRHI